MLAPTFFCGHCEGIFARGNLFLNDMAALGKNKENKGVAAMKKEEEKKPIPWEMVDPKPPVIQSGHMENRRAH